MRKIVKPAKGSSQGLPKMPSLLASKSRSGVTSELSLWCCLGGTCADFRRVDSSPKMLGQWNGFLTHDLPGFFLENLLPQIFIFQNWGPECFWRVSYLTSRHLANFLCPHSWPYTDVAKIFANGGYWNKHGRLTSTTAPSGGIRSGQMKHQSLPCTLTSVLERGCLEEVYLAV